jgi:hypothetical protein
MVNDLQAAGNGIEISGILKAGWTRLPSSIRKSFTLIRDPEPEPLPDRTVAARARERGIRG